MTRPSSRRFAAPAGVAALVAAAACGPSVPGAVDGGAAGDGAEAVDGAGAPDASAPGLATILVALRDHALPPAALDALLREVAIGPGWPLHEEGRWLFARRWDDAPDGAALVGDWNAWSPTADPAARSAGGAHAYVVVDGGAPSGHYKWWAEGAFLAPPEATAYGHDEFGEFGFVAPPDGPHFERFPGFGSAALEGRTIRVRTPAAAAARTVLFHDGQNVIDPDAPHGGWRADAAVGGSAALDDVLLVAVDATAARIDEYTHVADAIGDGPVGGDADAYWSLIDDRILPFVRARYGVAAAGASLAIAGSSLGGLVTLYGAMATPARAGCAIAMSSTLGWGSFVADDDATLIERWPAAAGHAAVALVVDSGGGVDGACVDADADGVDDDADDRDNFCTTQQMLEVLRGVGYADGVDLAAGHAAGAAHDEAAWAARLPGALAACAAMGWAPPP